MAWPAVGLAAGWSPSWCWPNAQEAPDAGRQTTCARRHWWSLEDGTEVKVQSTRSKLLLVWQNNVIMRRTLWLFKVLPTASRCVEMVSSPTICLQWQQTWDEDQSWKNWTSYSNYWLNREKKNMDSWNKTMKEFKSYQRGQSEGRHYLLIYFYFILFFFWGGGVTKTIRL